MTALVSADATPIVLATALFEEVSSLTAAPSDGVYADCLISLAFQHLLVGLQAEGLEGSDKVMAAAGAIERCGWLSEAVRGHVSSVLREAAAGRVPAILASQVALGAANRTTHQQVIDCMRAIGSDAVTDLVDGLLATRH